MFLERIVVTKFEEQLLSRAADRKPSSAVDLGEGIRMQRNFGIHPNLRPYWARKIFVHRTL